MDAVKGAVACAAVAVALGCGLSTTDPARRAALWDGARAALGEAAPAAAPPARPVAAPSPAAVPSASPARLGEESVAADRLGQFHAEAEIDGRRLPVMVDTGASFVALSAEDADRLGIRPAPSDFRVRVGTANGEARAAPVRLRSVRLGGVEIRDVDALVSGRGQLGETLLGMSFLSRLSGFRVEGRRLILTP